MASERIPGYAISAKESPMSTFRQSHDRSNRFLPRIESLEDRQLLSQYIPHPPLAPPELASATMDSFHPATMRADFTEGSDIKRDQSNMDAKVLLSLQQDSSTQWSIIRPATMRADFTEGSDIKRDQSTLDNRSGAVYNTDDLAKATALTNTVLGDDGPSESRLVAHHGSDVTPGLPTRWYDCSSCYQLIALSLR